MNDIARPAGGRSGELATAPVAPHVKAAGASIACQSTGGGASTAMRGAMDCPVCGDAALAWLYRYEHNDGFLFGALGCMSCDRVFDVTPRRP